jgi:hypothetical protein
MIQSCLLVSQDDRALGEESRDFRHSVEGTEEESACKVKKGRMSVITQARTIRTNIYLPEKYTSTREEAASILRKLREDSTDSHTRHNKRTRTHGSTEGDQIRT